MISETWRLWGDHSSYTGVHTGLPDVSDSQIIWQKLFRHHSVLKHIHKLKSKQTMTSR